MNKDNFKSQDKPVFQPQEFGVSTFEKQRQKWVSKDQAKKPLPANYAKQEEIDEDEREEIYEIIEQIKPPYEAFAKYIRLSDMVQCLNEVWEYQEG